MGTEIERKFLVTGDAWRVGATATRMRQGYLSPGPPVSVRIRIEGDEATLNIKESSLSVSRAEFEYAVPIQDAEELLAHCTGGIIAKTRYRVAHATHTWEIDVFEGDNAGLVLAEVELTSEDEPIQLPGWAGQEVSTDPRYRNTYLAERPFSTWDR